MRAGRQEHAAHELLISSVIVADVPLAGLSFHSLNSSAHPRPCTGRGRYAASRMQQPDL
jgi:hypothetical protein